MLSDKNIGAALVVCFCWGCGDGWVLREGVHLNLFLFQVRKEHVLATASVHFKWRLHGTTSWPPFPLFPCPFSTFHLQFFPPWHCITCCFSWRLTLLSMNFIVATACHPAIQPTSWPTSLLVLAYTKSRLYPACLLLHLAFKYLTSTIIEFTMPKARFEWIPNVMHRNSRFFGVYFVAKLLRDKCPIGLLPLKNFGFHPKDNKM